MYNKSIVLNFNHQYLSSKFNFGENHSNNLSHTCTHTHTHTHASKKGTRECIYKNNKPKNRSYKKYLIIYFIIDKNAIIM